MNRRLFLGGAAVALVAAPGARSQDRRLPLALLSIGNGAFAGYPNLPNPARDADRVNRAFAYLGYSTTQIINADRTDFMRRVRNYTASIRRMPTPAKAIIYVASHGVQVANDNVLVPINAAGWRSESDALNQGIRLSWMLSEIAGCGAHSAVFLIDACRNNPFSGELWTGGGGLAAVAAPTAVSSPNAQSVAMPGGFALSFATQPGQVALDGKGSNGPYAEAVSTILEQNPRASCSDFFRLLEEQVVGVTNGAQRPWLSSTLPASDSFL